MPTAFFDLITDPSDDHLISEAVGMTPSSRSQDTDTGFVICRLPGVALPPPASPAPPPAFHTPGVLVVDLLQSSWGRTAMLTAKCRHLTQMTDPTYSSLQHGDTPPPPPHQLSECRCTSQYCPLLARTSERPRYHSRPVPLRTAAHSETLCCQASWHNGQREGGRGG